MRRRRRNGANLGMVPPRGRGSDSRSRTYGRDALSGGNGGGRSRHSSGGRSRHGGGCRSRHGNGNRGCRSSDGDNKGCSSSGDGSRAKVGAAGIGRRRLSHSGSEAMYSARLHHGWVEEGEEMERRGGGEISEVIWNERGGGGGGGGGVGV